MAALTLALDGSKGLRAHPPWRLTGAGRRRRGSHCCAYSAGTRAATATALFQPEAVHAARTFSLGLGGQLRRAYRQRHAALYDAGVSCRSASASTPFHAGLMMIPMVLGSMGMKRIVVQVVGFRFGYRRVLVATRRCWPRRWSPCCLWPLLLAGWYWRCCRSSCSGRGWSTPRRFLLHEHPDPERPARTIWPSSGNQLCCRWSCSCR